MEQLTTTYPTDTTHPQQSIPIYFIHSIELPFCPLPGCWCQANKANITPLLTALNKGELTVSAVTTFADDTAL
jgi:hypothetical protein